MFILGISPVLPANREQEGEGKGGEGEGTPYSPRV